MSHNFSNHSEHIFWLMAKPSILFRAEWLFLAIFSKNKFANWSFSLLKIAFFFLKYAYINNIRQNLRVLILNCMFFIEYSPTYLYV
jgi:hypothetical protein